jgi:hypothetical protein
VSFVKSASTKNQLTSLSKPVLSAKIMISSCLDAKPCKFVRTTSFLNGWTLRVGCRHGLSDEEKKNTSDNFELHLELGNLINVAVVLKGFFVPKNFKSRLILQNCQDKFYAIVVWIQIIMLQVTASQPAQNE